MRLEAPISEIKGVGEKLETVINKLGVYTIGDILLRFPRDYIQYPPAHEIKDILPDKKQAVLIQVTAPAKLVATRKMQITVLNVSQFGVGLEAVWFRLPYIHKNLTKGKKLVLYGNVTFKNNSYHMEHPDVYAVEEYDRITKGLYPIYALTKGITNKVMVKTINGALDIADEVKDIIPDRLAKKHDFFSCDNSVRLMHNPADLDELVQARRRIVYGEFFEFIMSLKLAKSGEDRQKNTFDFVDYNSLEKYISSLPFELTGAQKKTLAEVVNDLHSPYLAKRLIQGDVGSGKTIIAFLTMLMASDSGYQSVLMAPTEVLATQHYDGLVELLAKVGVEKEIVLLTGSMKAKEKKEAYNIIKDTKDAIIIGTHALIQEAVEYNNLAVVITDEQHRFGVKQRSAFEKKGHAVHSFVMSATPIPRTLAIILYGDLDISVMNELPAERLPIKTAVVGEEYRKKTNNFILGEVQKGHQVYIICPLVEESEAVDAFNVVDYTENLKKVMPDSIRIGLLHGKMKASEKDGIMLSFKNHEIDVLVSTTVIEVGINVPNATLMVIENADRFGLATLHQLRGRVGRGADQSYCILVNSSDTDKSKERLEVLYKSNDGFKIAEADLSMRGPGDFFGIRQSGDMSFAVADSYQDSSLLTAAAEDVANILNLDPTLSNPENEQIRKKVDKNLNSNTDGLAI